MASRKGTVPVEAEIMSVVSSPSSTHCGDPEKRDSVATNADTLASSDSNDSTAHGSISEDAEAQGRSDAPPKREPLVLVPRSERRGLLGRFALVAEAENPYDYSNRTKWVLTVIVAFSGVAAPLGSTILLPSLTDIGHEFGSSETVTNLSVSFYLLSLSLWPLWWSFFSEQYGRRSIYVISFTLFALWNVVTAVSNNIALFIVMRFLAGGAAGSVQSTGAGTIADIWESKERGMAMGAYYIGPLCGPLFAPLIGGGLQEWKGWRASGWFMVIYGVGTLVLLILCLPETLPNRKDATAKAEAQAAAAVRHSDGGALTRTSTRQSIAKHTTKWAVWFKMAFINPLLVIKYLRYPPIAICVTVASTAFASLYILQISIQSTFEKAPYNFNALEIGAAYLFNSVGYLAASYLGGRWNDYIMIREAKKAKRYDEKGKLLVQPEDRMRENAALAAVMYPCAILWYGWAADKFAPWPAALSANFFFGFGSMIIFGLTTTMLTEFMPQKASSGVAVNNFCRNICSCVGSLVCQPLLNAIGSGWLFTALFIISSCMGSLVWLMKRNGPKWRIEMNEMLKKDK